MTIFNASNWLWLPLTGEAVCGVSGNRIMVTTQSHKAPQVNCHQAVISIWSTKGLNEFKLVISSANEDRGFKLNDPFLLERKSE